MIKPLPLLVYPIPVSTEMYEIDVTSGSEET